MDEEKEVLKAKIEDLETEAVKLKARIIELTKENEFLKKELARVGSYGDDRKKELLLKVVIAHPDCYSKEEFSEAVEEALKKD